MNGIRFLPEFQRHGRSILTPEEAYQPAIRCRYGRALEIVLSHECCHLLDGHKRPESAWSWPHGFLNPEIGRTAELTFTQ
jgi:hypothetical protein